MSDNDSKLAERLEAARERSNALAASAANKAREFVRENPAASVAGGIVIGALIAGLLTRQATRKPADSAHEGAEAVDGGAVRLARLAALGAELALAYAARAASTGKDGVGKIEERIAGQLGKLGETSTEAGHRLGALAEVAIQTLREAGESAIHRLTHRD